MHENSTSRRRPRPVAGRGLAAVAAGLACAAGLAAGSPALAATGHGPALVTPIPKLNAVSADSATDAWAVGTGYHTASSEYASLTLHWNGTKWARVTSPNPGGTSGTFLYGVSATSSGNAWAVGSSGVDALIMGWNGTKWATASIPTLTGVAQLNSVSVDSATDAWAVGLNNNSNGMQALVLNWNGTSWTQIALPDPTGVSLNQVKAISPDDVWAGGATTSGEQAVMLHWDGTSWTQTTLPLPSGASNASVTAIGASSATNAWAVGTDVVTPNDETGEVSWHLNGSTWTPETVPNGEATGTPSTGLVGVDTLSASSAWAVGWYVSAQQSGAPMALHWNGKAWKQASTPIPATDDTTHLNAVNSQATDNVWAVGWYTATATGGTAGTYTLHWNGKSWKRINSPN